MGKPTILPDYNPLREIIEPNKEGIFFRKSNAESLFSSVELLVKDSRLAEQIGKAAKAKLLMAHTWQKNAGLVLDCNLR